MFAAVTELTTDVLINRIYKHKNDVPSPIFVLRNSSSMLIVLNDCSSSSRCISAFLTFEYSSSAFKDAECFAAS